jgi:hypothetical protein
VEGRPGTARIAAAPGRLGSEVKKKKKGKGRGEADRWGPLVSEKKTKEKERSGVGWRGEKADGPLGQKGREVSFLFFFLFSNSFQIKLFLLNSNQNPSNLFTKFHILFRSHTSNQKPCKAKR